MPKKSSNYGHPKDPRPNIIQLTYDGAVNMTEKTNGLASLMHDNNKKANNQLESSVHR